MICFIWAVLIVQKLHVNLILISVVLVPLKKYLVVAVQRKNIFENMTRVILNLDLLGVAMKVNQNFSVLCVTKCFQTSV